MDWSPVDEAELAAGWRLWLELADRSWPNATWDGTPADAARELDELVRACDEIQSDYLAAGGRQDAAVVGLLRSLVLSIGPVSELWRDDSLPLEAGRGELLHTDLAGFAAHAQRVLGLLADGGGWPGLNATHRRYPG